jgi:hypothetical protein
VTSLPVNFRSCRDTGITWLALAGVSLQAVRARAGHEDVETTLGYVKMAEDLTGKVGAPFPPLPSELVGRRWAQPMAQPPRPPAKLLGIPGPEEGIESAEPVGSARTHVVPTLTYRAGATAGRTRGRTE